MAWYVTLFWVVIGLCALLYVMDLARGLFAREQSSRATVEKRYREEFPYTVGLHKKNRLEHYLVFQTAEGKSLKLSAREELYSRCPKGTSGILRWRGSVLVDFQIDSAAIESTGEENIL